MVKTIGILSVEVLCYFALKYKFFSNIDQDYATKFFLSLPVIPGQPRLSSVKSIGTKQIALSFKRHEEIRCLTHHFFDNGVKLQTRVKYQSKWDREEKVVSDSDANYLIIYTQY